MRSIEKKLLRDLWGMRGQALAIALVIVSGIATFIMSLSTLDSLMATREAYYRGWRFSEVFAHLERAPEGLARRIADIPGVDRVETRVSSVVKVDVEGFPDPVTARIQSIPDTGEPLMNRLYIREGRSVEPGREDEVVISEATAEAHGFRPGDTIEAVIRGKYKRLRIVGLAMSPEHIYQISSWALFPDYKRYGVFWMGRSSIEAALDMEGAFNDVVLSLEPGASKSEVIDRLDEILDPYGGLGAYGREDQVSHRYLSEEFRMLERMAVMFPVIFLGVAAFLLNIVVTRLVSTQRDQIAILKAFGYTDFTVGLHYVKFIVLIALAGVAGGIVAGAWLGRGLTDVYIEFYRFPFVKFVLPPRVVVAAALISIGASVVGALGAVRRAAALPPAEAMRPEPPVSYRATLIERAGFQRLLSQPSRMILRHIERRPVKSLLTVVGIAFACAIMMVGRFQEDSVDYMVSVQFNLSQRDDVSVFFTEPTSARALYELEEVEGIEYGEPFRYVPARLKFEHREYKTAIMGLPAEGDLFRLLDADLKEVPIPAEGIIMTDYLGTILGLKAGDLVTVEALDGARPVVQVPVAGFVKEYIGLSAYMEIGALNRLMREGGAISGANLAADPDSLELTYRELTDMPRVAGIIVRKSAIQNFYDTMGDTLLIFTAINTILAATIAFGVVYNSARIALSERGRELASLRVLGFTRGEISYILLGELAVLTLAAIPVGLLIGRALCAYIASYLVTDLYRVPLILEPSTYAFASVVIIVSAFVSGLLVKNRLNMLDLVAVLKTRE